MKRRLRKLHKVILSLLFALFCCAMVPVMAQQDGAGVFMSLQLPSLSDREIGSQDCALGSFAADALRAGTGAQLAIVCGGELGSDLPQGELSFQEVEQVFSGEYGVALAAVTPSQLKALLEELVGRVTLDMSTERIDREASSFEGFPNLSGCTMVYDASAPLGDRIVSVTLEDETALDLTDNETTYVLAASTALLDGSYGTAPIQAEAAGLSFAEVLYDYLAAVGRGLNSLDWKRITAIGANDNNIIDLFPTPALLAVCLLVPIACMIWVNRRRPT